MNDHDPLGATSEFARRDGGNAASSPDHRDVLFGRWLVHTGFADQETVDRALGERSSDPTRPLAEILVQSGVISARERQLVEQLVDTHLAKHGNDPQQSLSSLAAATVSLAKSPVDATIPHQRQPGNGPLGDKRFGDYELLDEIARGGMGVVYKARQVQLDRLVALKMILSGELSSEQQVRRFYAEAEAAAKLDHPGIVPVYEVGQIRGQHFYSMAFVQGKSLNDLVKADGPLPPQAAAKLLKIAAAAVQYAHDKGIVHRDIKPHNILLDEQQQPRVTDFGLAKQVEAQSELTASGQVMGTPSYMPPEQAKGEIAAVGPVSDVYSLGATLYFLLSGRPPFQTLSPTETLRQVMDNDPVPLRRLDPTIPRDLETICLKCLRKERDKRYPTAAALADDLGRWLEHKPIVARRVSRSERAWLWCQRRPAIASLLAVLVLTVVTGSLVFHERQNATQASGLVDALVKADAEQVPGLVQAIGDYRRWTEPLLRQRLVAAREGSVEQLLLRLALLPVDESHVPPLLEDLLVRDTRLLPAIRDGLQPHQAQISPTLWATLQNQTEAADRRFRAGLALASYAPNAEEWRQEPPVAAFLAEQLVRANAEHQPRLRMNLRPIQDRLLTDLENIFADPAMSESRQVSAANALAEFAAQDTVRLARLLTLATPEQYKVLYPVMTEVKHTAASETLAQLVRETPGEDLSPADRVSLGQRRAGAAITLLRQGQREQIFDVLRVGADPESLTQFVHRCQARGVTASELLECVERVDVQRQSLSGAARHAEDRVLFGLLLALGDFPVADIAPAVRQPFVDRLLNWYGQDPTSGIHGATGWLLRHWGFEQEVTKVDQTPVPYDATGQRDWFTLAIKCRTNGLPFGLVSSEETLYFTFVVFPPGEYTLGSPDAETDRQVHEKLHRVKLTRPLAVCDRELTWGQFNPMENRQRHDAYELKSNHKLADDDPAWGINWYEAVTYCRWLTAQAQWGESSQCYDDPATLPKDPVGNPQYERIDLQRGGFRLPTATEWEVVCRSGTRTAYSFGNDVHLLGQYGWFQDTSHKRSHAVGQLRPNPRGLFDLHGNLIEWCHDWSAPDYAAEAEDPSGPSRGSSRVCRGGGWSYDAAICRTACRSWYVPSNRSIFNGFRLALSPSGVTPEAGPVKGAEPSGGGTGRATAEPRLELP